MERKKVKKNRHNHSFSPELLTLFRDFFWISLTMFSVLSWIEWKSPGSISRYFNHWWLLCFVVFFFMLSSFSWTTKICSKITSIVESIKKGRMFPFFTLPLFIILIFLTIAIEYHPFFEEFLSWHCYTLIYATTICLGIITFGKKFKIKTNTETRRLSKIKKINLLLFFIILLGFSVRVYQLDFLDPAGDEYRHLIAMKRYLQEGFFEYDKSKITTYLLVFVHKITNSDSIFILRFPFVILGTISIFLIYLFGKNLINRKVGLISAFLLAFMPLSIGISRYIRGYTIEVFITLLSLAIFHSKRKILKNIYFRIGLSLTIFKLFTVANNESRMNMFFKLFMAYMLVHLISKHLTKLRLSVLHKLSVFLLIFFVGIGALFHISSVEIVRDPTLGKIDPESAYLFLFNFHKSTTNWFFTYIPSIFVFIICSTVFLVKFKRERIYPLIFINFFVFFIFIFLFNYGRRFQVRYIFNILPYFIPLLSIGIYYFLEIFKKEFKIKRSYIIASVLFLLILTFPIKGVYYTINEEKGEYNKKTMLPHYNATALMEFVQNEKIDKNKIITSTPWIFDFYLDQELDFLTVEEKKDYIFLPRSQNFNLKDRTEIFYVSGYTSGYKGETHQAIRGIIANNDIEYLIFRALPARRNDTSKGPFYYRPEHLSIAVPEVVPIKILGENSNFGFYIYKVK